MQVFNTPNVRQYMSESQTWNHHMTSYEIDDSKAMHIIFFFFSGYKPKNKNKKTWFWKKTHFFCTPDMNAWFNLNALIQHICMILYEFTIVSVHDSIWTYD